MKFIFRHLYFAIILSLTGCNPFKNYSVVNLMQEGLIWDNGTTTYDLGDVGIGSIKSKTFILTNKSNVKAINCDTPYLTNETDFTIESTTCASEMEPFASCEVVITASPQSQGLKDVNIVRSCDLDSTRMNPVTAAKVNAVVTNVSWTPTTTKNYGSVAIGDYAASTYNFTLTNAGTQSVTGCGTVTLSNSTDFEIDSNTCTNPTLLPTETCVIGLRAKPMSGGLKRTSITRDCAGVGTVATQLSKIKVTGVAPVLAWSPLTYSFGTQSVGTDTDTTFTLSNSSSVASAKTCSAPTLSNTTDFSLINDTCGTSNLSTSSNCTVDVRANPQSAGLKQTTLSRICVIGGTVSTTADQITVTGEIPAPVLAWNQMALDLGNVDVGDESNSQIFELENTGNSPATSCGLPTLSNTTDFLISSDSCQLNDLNNGSTCQVQVRARPSSAGIKRTTLSRTCAVGGVVSTTTDGIESTGVATYLADWSQAHAAVTSGSFSFNTVSLSKQSNELTFMYRNPTKYVYTGCSVPSLDNTSDFTLMNYTCSAGGMAKASMCFVTVKANPQSDGTATATLNRSCDQSGTNSSINLTAIGVDATSSPMLVNAKDYAQIATGEGYSCGLVGSGPEAGQVRCWGDNGLGQLGDGTATARLTPVLVSGLAHVTQIALDRLHSCALIGSGSEAGQVRCWGWNNVGQLGDGTTTDSLTPVLVSGLNNVSQIANGGYHSCALMGSGPEAGQVRCWGYNGSGQLGDGTTTSASTSVLVSGLNNVSQISLGYYHSCALMGSGPEAGQVRCWGYNYYGQLGDGTITNSLTSVLVSGLSNIIQIAMGTHDSCALMGSGPEAGQVRCWGYNGSGQLGDSTTIDRTTPVLVSGLSNVSQITTGSYHSCALVESSQVRCWGRNNDGELGDGTTMYRTTPVPVKQELKEQIAVGREHSCSLSKAGQVRCWGYNGNGQLGDGTRTTRLTSVLVSGLNNVSQIALGDYHSCAVIGSGPEAGQVRCWGYNNNGQLGDGTTTNSNTPVLVSGLNNVSQIALGYTHSCAVIGSGSEAGQVRCWGSNYNGQLGDGTTTDRLMPELVSGLNNVSQVTVGNTHSCGLMGSGPEAGQVRCWGDNTYGKLGDGTMANSSTPVLVSGLNNVSQIALGYHHSCGLMGSGPEAGQVRCWGYNGEGELGDGTTIAVRLTSVLVSGLNNVSQIALGYSHSCAVIGSGPEAGQVRCWGANYYGELGDGTIDMRLTSVLVSGLNNVSQIALGTFHSCALMGSGPEAGQVRCWGANYYGELGDGTTTNSLTSVLVSGLNNVSQIALGSYHSCGLIGSGPEAGLVRCWGRNNYSQLGDGTTTNSLTSVLVSGLSHVSQIALGTYHSCALIGSGPEAGLARCWGLNNYGQLGDGTKTSRNKPVYRMNLTNIQSIGISRGNHQCVVTSTQEVSCSGDNQSFQTGFNELTIRNVSGF